MGGGGGGGGSGGHLEETIWGCDSCTQASDKGPNNSLPAFATRVQNYFAGEGGNLTWWGRYFRPSPPCPQTFDVKAQDEANALKAAGFNFVLPITSPGYIRTGGDFSKGAADARQTCDSIYDLANRQILFLPSQCYVFLNIERGQPFAKEYWNGWADGVYGWTTNSPLKGPFWPGCYCNPLGTAPGESMPCSKLASGSYASFTWIWASAPSTLPCSKNYCHSPYAGPFSPAACAGGPPTQIWQYALAPDLGGTPPNCASCRSDFPQVDLDMSNGVLTQNMLRPNKGTIII